jgi:hypothetical protein
MSEKPQGGGFSLPDDLIKGLEKYSADNEEFLKKREAESSQEKVLVEEDLNEDVEDVAFEYDKNNREDVSKRSGGLDFRKRASKAMADAQKKDEDAPIFVKSENTPRNKKSNEKSADQRKYKRIKEKQQLPIKRDNLRGVSVSSLPDENEIENTNFPKNHIEKPEKNYKDISKEEPDIEFYSDSEISQEKTEPKKTLETAVEKAMKATQEVANEYNETKLKKEDTLKMIIEKVQSGELSIDYVTRSGGLRQKVFDLISAPAPVIEPETKPETKPEPVFESKEEIVQEIKKPEIVLETKPEIKTEIKPAPKPEEDMVWKMPEVAKKEVINELPEAPLPPVKVGKPKISIDDADIEAQKKEFFGVDLKLIEGLESKRANLEEAHRKLDSVKNRFNSPFKKFLLKAFNKGLKDIKAVVDENKKVESEYSSAFDEVVEIAAEKELERLEALHANSREKKEYQVINIEDIPKDLLKTYPEVETFFKFNNQIGEGISLTTLLKKETQLPMSFKRDLRDAFPDIVFEKVKSQISRRLAKQQDLKI